MLKLKKVKNNDDPVLVFDLLLLSLLFDQS